MKFRIYLALLRPRTLLTRIALAVIYGLLLSVAHRVLHPAAGAPAFLWWVFILPLAFGYELSRMVQHGIEPFRALLPAARRVLLRAHLPFLGALAVLFGSIGASLDAYLGWPTAIALAAVGLTITLPLDTGWRWAGSRWATAGIGVVLLVAMVEATTTRELVLRFSAFAVIGCFALVAVSCRLSVPARRLDLRGVRRVELTDPFDLTALETRGRERLARSRRVGRRWTLARVHSGGDFVRAVLHETYGFRWGWLGQLAALPLVCWVSFMAGAAVPRWIRPQTTSASLADLVYTSLCNPGEYPRHDDPPSFLLLIPLAIVAMGFALPRPERPYPISRRRRAELTFRVTILQSAIMAAIVSGSFALLAWFAAQRATAVIVSTGSPVYLVVLLTAAPVLPWVFWARLYGLVRPDDRSMHALLLFTAMLVTVLAATIVPRISDWHVTSTGGTVIALATCASLLLYHRALVRFYERGDLLQRATTRHNLSLV